MAVNYAAGIKTTRMQAVRDAIDAGAGTGKLELGTAGMGAVLVTITLADPASSVAADVLTLLGVPLSNDATAGGTLAEARIRDSDNNDVVTGLTVGTSGTDIIVDNTSVANGQTVKVNSGTLTHAA